MDGRYVCIAAAGNVLFPRLAKAMGREDLLDDARFATLADRARNADAINEEVAAWCRRNSLAEIERLLIEHEGPVSWIYTAAEIAGDPQVRARRSIVGVEDPELGTVNQQAPVPRLDRTPLEIKRGAPRLGEHTDEVLTELLGLDANALRTLRADGVI